MNLLIKLLYTMLPTMVLAPDAGTLQLETEPQDLPGTRRSGDERITHESGNLVFAEDGFVTSFQPALIGADGAPVSGDLLHHWVLGDLNEGGQACERHPHDFRPFVAAGGELTSLDLPEGYGIPVEAGRPLVWQLMLGNPTSVPVSEVRFRAEFGFAPAEADLRPLEPVWLDVDSRCREHGYPVAGDSTDVRTHTVRFPFDGDLVVAAGHMHEGGQMLRLVDTETGEELVRFEPEVIDGVAVVGAITLDRPIRVEAGRDYLVEAVHRAEEREHAMGIVMALVAPLDG